MQFNPLSHNDRVEKSIVLTNRIIVKALQSDRGDIIRVMNVADLKNMLKCVFNGVYNKLALDAQRAYDCAVDKYELDQDCIVVVLDEKFKPSSDVEIEERVTAYFEIDGKLQYCEVLVESVIALQGIDKSVDWLTQQMKMGAHGMRYEPVSTADRLEKADILTNAKIMTTLACERGDFIRAMSHSEFKRMRKEIFSIYYRMLAAEAADGFEPKTEFEIDQEIKAYFEEQGTLH